MKSTPSQSATASLLLLVSAFFFVVAAAAGKATQYSHAESPQTPVLFCVSAVEGYDDSTQTTAVSVTFGHQGTPAVDGPQLAWGRACLLQ